MKEETVVNILINELEKRGLTYRKECPLRSGYRIDIVIYPERYKRKDYREKFIKKCKTFKHYPEHSILIECKGDTFSDNAVLEQLNNYYRQAGKTNAFFFALPFEQAKRFAWFFHKFNKKIGVIGIFWEGIDVLYNPFNIEVIK